MSAANGALNTNTGSDIVAWVVVRHCHEPRYQTEEATFLPYQSRASTSRAATSHASAPTTPTPTPTAHHRTADHNAANWPHLDSACPSPRPLAAGAVL